MPTRERHYHFEVFSLRSISENSRDSLFLGNSRPHAHWVGCSNRVTNQSNVCNNDKRKLYGTIDCNRHRACKALLRKFNFASECILKSRFVRIKQFLSFRYFLTTVFAFFRAQPLSIFFIHIVLKVMILFFKRKTLKCP